MSRVALEHVHSINTDITTGKGMSDGQLRRFRSDIPFILINKNAVVTHGRVTDRILQIHIKGSDPCTVSMPI